VKPLALLDTSVLLQLDQCLEQHLAKFASSVIVRAELMAGIELRRLKGDEIGAGLRELLVSACDEAGIWRNLDSGFTQTYGAIVAPLFLTAPAKARSRDALIAAHAAYLNIPVVTANQNDFNRFAVNTITQKQAYKLIQMQKPH